MNSAVLKILACTFMLMDHIGLAFFPSSTMLRIIGRMAFPIFAWQISIGYKNTSNIKNYIIRLSLFALISQIPYMLVIRQDALNIFFTLTFGVLCIYIYKQTNSKVLGLLAACLILSASNILNVDYGAYGVAMIFLFYLFFENNLILIISQSIITMIYSVITGILMQAYCLMAIIPIGLYNGKKGPGVRYLFYVFYPAHLLMIYLIKLLI